MSATSTSYSPDQIRSSLSVRSTASAASQANTGYNQGPFSSGGNTPSVYILVFLSVCSVLVAVAAVFSLRAMRARRNLHRMWADEGYSDDFFLPSHPAYPLRQRWGGPSFTFAERLEEAMALVTQKAKTSDAPRPEMFEIGMKDEDLEKGAGEAYGASWLHINPVSVTSIVPPHLRPSARAPPVQPVFHPPPPFFQTFFRPPMRPPLPPPPPPPPPLDSEFLLDAEGCVEVGVFIALPVDPQSRLSTLSRDDDEREVPEIEIGIGRVLLK